MADATLTPDSYMQTAGTAALTPDAYMQQTATTPYSLREFITSPHGLIREGLRRMGTGFSELTQPGFDPKAQGAHDIIAGAGSALTPALLPLAVANPLPAVAALAGGAAGSTLGQMGAHALDAGPGTTNLAGDVGGIAGGAAVGGFIPNPSWSTMGRTITALPHRIMSTPGVFKIGTGGLESLMGGAAIAKGEPLFGAYMLTRGLERIGSGIKERGSELPYQDLRGGPPAETSPSIFRKLTTPEKPPREPAWKNIEVSPPPSAEAAPRPIPTQTPSGRKPGSFATQSTEPITTTPAVPAGPDPKFLDDLSRSQAGKSYRSLSPEDKAAIQRLAAKLQPTAAPIPLTPPGPALKPPPAAAEPPSTTGYHIPGGEERNPTVAPRELRPNTVINAQAETKNTVMAQRLLDSGMTPEEIGKMDQSVYDAHRAAVNAERAKQGMTQFDRVRPGPNRRTWEELRGDLQRVARQIKGGQ